MFEFWNITVLATFIFHFQCIENTPFEASACVTYFAISVLGLALSNIMLVSFSLFVKRSCESPVNTSAHPLFVYSNWIRWHSTEASIVKIGDSRCKLKSKRFLFITIAFDSGCSIYCSAPTLRTIVFAVKQLMRSAPQYIYSKQCSFWNGKYFMHFEFETENVHYNVEAFSLLSNKATSERECEQLEQ